MYSDLWELSMANHSIDTLQWRHNECNDVSNHQCLNCLLSRLFRCRSKKTPKLRLTGLGEGNSPVTGEFPAQKARKMFPFADVIMLWDPNCTALVVAVGHAAQIEVRHALLSVDIYDHELCRGFLRETNRGLNGTRAYHRMVYLLGLIHREWAPKDNVQ